MKKILLSLVAALTVAFASAQLPNGSVSPDFTGVDLEGNTWHLYELLDQGKSVVVDVSAAWCGPCWNYHNSGALETLYEEYGPDGTNEIMVLFIEGEGTNTGAQITGTSSGSGVATYSQGDWTEGTPYPIIDNADIANDLQITYFPTVYTICPSRIITETGQITAEEHYDFISQSSCQPASLATDPAFLGVSVAGGTCDDSSVDVTVTLQNFGTETLTAATITVTGGTSPVVYEWTGSLATYQTSEVNVGSVPMDGSGMLNVNITSADGNSENSQLAVLAGLTESSTHIRIDLLTDNWPAEVSWDIKNDGGTTVASGSGYSAAHTVIYEDVFVPSTGCYTFTYHDVYGDGLHGAQWGDVDGHLYAYGVDAGGNVMDYIYFNNGSYNIGSTLNTPASESKDANVTMTVGVQELSGASKGFNVYPNPANELINLSYSLTSESMVTVDVVNMLGARVMSEKIGSQRAGSYNSQLNLSSLSAGVYMVNLNANGATSTVRVTVNK